MENIKRNADGTFPPGTSGNLRGRPPKKPARHRLPAHNRRVAFEVAEMPVPVVMDGKVGEASGYHAVLMAMLKKALDGHAPSMKAFLAEVRGAAVVNGEQAEFTRWLIEEQEKLEAELDKLRELLPKDPGHGTYIQMPDGSLMHNSVHHQLERLKSLDEREAALNEKEKRLALRESALDLRRGEA